MLHLPKILSYKPVGNVIVTNDDTTLVLDVTIRMVDYYGNYNLGKRDVPGGCVDIELIAVKEISNVC